MKSGEGMVIQFPSSISKLYARLANVKMANLVDVIVSSRTHQTLLKVSKLSTAG
jgi:hypothetical protein